MRASTNRFSDPEGDEYTHWDEWLWDKMPEDFENSIQPLFYDDKSYLAIVCWSQKMFYERQYTPLQGAQIMERLIKLYLLKTRQ